MAKLVQVIYAEDTAGSGLEGNPHRKLSQLWLSNGELLLQVDPETQAATVNQAALARLA